ncbi:hypothetical protein E9549_09545 [Blastococcus sp. MG754426]|uniref:hypothetical protein n=1 Tax=unclassified Blastococcus TaxID=2619396 RepID=UPI001EEF7C1A|nr:MULTISPECIES: hypothetical protein [unclassified Blastococcus]MCF6507648.1 hypothetical protein [Blastococcus sp. MG754426]MCF6512710.1 hypothetical protein [Blastococcus sp. MG754427]MCF6735842.1 hypothetical protein [Blastococcus sp. KM273129]
MRASRSRRGLGVLLLAAAAGLMTPGPAAAGTEERIGFASSGLDGTDPRNGRTLHAVLEVFDPPAEPAFGVTDFFVGGPLPGGGGEGVLYECTTEARVRARLDGLRSAGAGGVLPLICSSPVGLPDREGYAVVGMAWHGTGPVTRHVFDRGECTEHLDVRAARVAGGVRLVVPDVAVGRLVNVDPAESELRQQRVVCG